VNANRAYLLLLEADPPPFGLEAVRSERMLPATRPTNDGASLCGVAYATDSLDDGLTRN
jgi:hypothetical protein